MNTELQPTTQAELIDAINRLYHSAIGAASLATGHANNAITHAHQCGTLLCKAKGEIEHGDWLAWLEQHCPDVSERTAQNYMKLSKTQIVALLEENGLSGAYKKVGILPESAGGIGGGIPPSPEAKTMTYVGNVNKWLTENLDKLDEAKREEWKRTLKPIAEAYKAIGGGL